MSCGAVIKEQAAVCPECGVQQRERDDQPEPSNSELSDARKYELQKVAGKDKGVVAVVSFLLPFVGYLMIGKTGLAVINFITLNYFLTGFLVVPIHTVRIIGNARDELARHGENW